MHGNVARPLYLEDQPIEQKAMEPNVGVIGNEIGHLRSDVNELKEEMKTVNKTLGELMKGQTRLEGDITTVRAEMTTIRAEIGTLAKQMDARVAVLETKIIKWVIATGTSCAGLAFTFAKLLTH